jgi:hypothetical protein
LAYVESRSCSAKEFNIKSKVGFSPEEDNVTGNDTARTKDLTLVLINLDI